MLVKSSFYADWHNKNNRNRIHLGVLAGYLLIISTMIFSSYQQAMAASDVLATWNFSDPSKYTIDTNVELATNTARLKAKNYQNDASTSALYHMDQLNGPTLNDSSSNGNNGAISNASFGLGNLNNGLSFNGNTSSVRVPDSPSLALSQKNTLEAWTKQNNNFSAGSSDHRGSIIDKGDYQLYFDNETGKVVYELANKNANTWSLEAGMGIKGSWDQSGNRSVNAQVKIGSDIYVGLGTDKGDAEVWKWNGSAWSQIGGGNPSLNGGWTSDTYEGVYSLATDGTNLYAGIGRDVGEGEVWQWNGSSWSQVGGDGINNSWPTAMGYQVWSMTYFNGKLYAGIGNSTGEVWQYDGTTWSRIGRQSMYGAWTTATSIVASLTNDGTSLYAGLGAGANAGEVWKWTSGVWSKLGSSNPQVNGSWGPNIETIRDLKFLGGYLYAGTGDTAGDGSLWKFNGSAWTKIGGDGVNSSWASATYEYVSSIAWDGANLYAGLGNSNGDGEVWKYNGTSWSQIGGDGLNSGWTTNQGDSVMTLDFRDGKLYAGTYDAGGDGLYYAWDGSSWSQLGGANVKQSWGGYGLGNVSTLQVQGGNLYAGTGYGADGNALVYQYNGSRWKQIGGQGVNGSWDPFTYRQVVSMASFGNKLIVGLGTVTSGARMDGSVWQWDGSIWTKIGGDGVNSSWLVPPASHYGTVDSMTSFGGNLYVGLGVGNTDGEVWRWNGSTWTKIGGDSLNGGWTNYVESVKSMTIYDNNLVVGLGLSGGDGEVWRWNGSTWTKIGGDGVSSSWGVTPTIESVESLVVYNNKLYAGLGNSAGDGTLWAYDGSSWSQAGGDNINGSWNSGIYHRVKALAVYNGDLFAGLGSGVGNGEVWRFCNGTWSKIGGNNDNGSWSYAIEEIDAMTTYRGKLYTGTGLSASADAFVYSWGDNLYLESNRSSFDTNWHHIAGTYDGGVAKIFIDGSQDSAAAENNFQINESNKDLLIGYNQGSREASRRAASFDGMIDELRISNDARSSLTVTPYENGTQTVTLAQASHTSGINHWDSFETIETLNGGSVKYRLSADNGASWLYWDGNAWAESASGAQSNLATVIDSHINTFPVTFKGLKWQAILTGNGQQQVTINSVTAKATSDLFGPTTTASNLVASKAKNGATMNQNDWTNGSSPYFSWDSASDNESGIKGYCLYLGQDSTADPVTTAGLLGQSPNDTGGNCMFMVTTNDVDLATNGYIATALATSSQPYYLRIKAIDKAGNTSGMTAQFGFRFDNTPPTNPAFVTAPSGFIKTKEVTLSWPIIGPNAPSDNESGIAGLQYRIGSSGTWYGDVHDGTGSVSDLLTNDGNYTTIQNPDFANINDGINNIYFRTWDQAGNVSATYVSAALKINTNGSPSEPLNVTASPTVNTSNLFSFYWSPPAEFVGDVNNLAYCYTINTLPSDSTCSFTSGGSTSLPTGAYATQPGVNTIYLVARDESGNINYLNYASATFTANTPAPGLPLNTDVVDLSVKATSNWRLGITWEQPTINPNAVASYKIFRSLDQNNWSYIGSSTSTTYIDGNLNQNTYFYKVQACDNANNCGVFGAKASGYPTGKFTSPSTLVAGPSVSGVTTRKAKISWSTDRNSDSKIAIGTKSGTYSASEVGSSSQTSAHEINIDNLAAGTTYYYVAKWTDEDGNTGMSQEYSFVTAPAPSLKEVVATRISLSGTTIQFTSSNATKINVVYGKSESFGGLKSVNTSTAESSYSVNLDGLDDGSKYFYKLVSYDTEGNSYEGSIYSFVTPARPHIKNLRFQPVTNKPTSTQQISWDTNVASSSTVVFSKLGGKTLEVSTRDMVTRHEVEIEGLEDDSEYRLEARSRDADGNLAVSELQTFRTALDTRPPIISNVTIEPSIRGVGAEARGQVVVSWRTDEPATSQVAYGEGAKVVELNNRTAEDTGLSTEHVVIVSDLPTSRVYTVKPVSRDKSGNAGEGSGESTIIGRASDSVLTMILNTLKTIFGL